MSTFRKKDIADLYKARSKISLEDAERYFCDVHMLDSVNEKSSVGLKLCTYLLLEKLGVERAWQLVKSFVTLANHKQQTYENIGHIFRKSYKDALTVMPAEGFVTRIDVAEHLFRPLMEHCIHVKREYAKKFCWILSKATFERDEHMSRMLYTVSTPIVWRYLTAINPHVRLGAYFVQVNVFPPSADDPIHVTDCFNRHCEAFVAALGDISVDICMQAIGNVCEVVSMYYDQIPEAFIDKIFNRLATLAKDDLAEIRAAVYHGLRYFYNCAKGVLKFEVLLKSICKYAIDDTSDHVRCNVFRLLNKMIGSRIKIIVPPKAENVDPLLDLTEVLHRLDYEENETVEREICRLIYTSFFHKNLPSEERYKVLNNMCHINRPACLDLHRMLYAINTDDTEGVLAHMSSVLTVSSRVLKKISSMYQDRDEKPAKVKRRKMSDVENQNFTDPDLLNKRMISCMNVIDCMIVCFSSMRHDPEFDGSNVQAQLITRYFSEIASEIITHFESRDDLVDTALSIVLLIRNAGMQASKLKNDCSRMLRAGHLNKRYLEIYGLIDMTELLDLLKKGLHQLENSFSKAEDSPKRKRNSQASTFAKNEIVVDAFMTLLNLPTCSEYIVERYTHYIRDFTEQFDRICDNFMVGLQRQHPVSMGLFKTCWKVWTVLIIIKHNESAFAAPEKIKKEIASANSRRRSAKIKAEIENDTGLDPMLMECLWMKRRINEHPKLSANSDLVEHFYDMIALHFQSYKHARMPIQTVMSYVKRLYRMKKEYPRKRSVDKSYQACLQAGEHALNFAEPDPEDLGIFEPESID